MHPDRATTAHTGHDLDEARRPATMDDKRAGAHDVSPPSARQKTCSACLLTKPVADFRKRIDSPDGLQGQCRTCMRVRSMTWPSNTRERARLRQIKFRYDLDADEYLAMLETQGGRCAICRQTESKSNKIDKTARTYQLSVDHDHDTRKVRGLLCDDCNMVLGRVNDDPELLEAMAAYLRRHRG